MNSYIMGKTAQKVLDLLHRVDDGYVLTEGELRNLKKISVADFSSMEFEKLPESIEALSQLTELIIYKIGLQEVPHWVRQLSKLKSLSLGGNPLKILPDWLGDMTELHTLDLRDLRLTAVPPSFLKLNIPFLTDLGVMRDNNGKGVYIKNTELSIQPVSLFDQSRDKSSGFQESRKLIKEYFETPKVPVRETKVIFLGDGKVGRFSACSMTAVRAIIPQRRLTAF